MRMKSAWLLNTETDILLETAILARVTEQKLNVNKRECIKRVNRTDRFAISHRFSLTIPKLIPNTLRVIKFLNAPFANQTDLSWQARYIILLVDKNLKCILIIQDLQVASYHTLSHGGRSNRICSYK